MDWVPGAGPTDGDIRPDEGDFVGMEALLLHTQAAFCVHEGSQRRCQRATGVILAARRE